MVLSRAKNTYAGLVFYFVYGKSIPEKVDCVNSSPIYVPNKVGFFKNKGIRRGLCKKLPLRISWLGAEGYKNKGIP